MCVQNNQDSIYISTFISGNTESFNQLILKYNDGVDISRNNILKIPRVIKSNSPIKDRLKPYIVKPKEGKWRIAYKHGISIDILENINHDLIRKRLYQSLSILQNMTKKLLLINKTKIEVSHQWKGLLFFRKLLLL